ncbi:MAG: hypothetical protein LUE23_10490 [Lachnospiraceae bacterium]|nr:hypothetical protein [Lachnospiraceae bacterium]
MKKTNILVLRMKEVVYTLIFLLLGIFLVFLLIHMFSRDPASSTTSAIYTPGVYTSEMNLGGRTVNVEVTVDADRINSVRLVDLSDSVAAMYPLIEPAMESLEEQIVASQSLEDITYEESSKYTSEALLEVIESTLEKARK